MKGVAVARNRVLVVEDDAYFRQLVCETLHDRRIDCVGVGNEREATEYLAKYHDELSVVLLDLRFPTRATSNDADAPRGRIAGVRVARLIREKYPRTRVIGMSLFADTEGEEWFLRNGSGFLRKTWLTGGAVSEFADVVERVVRARVRKRKPRTFIIHGHDTEPVHSLARFIQSDLGWPAPAILRDLPSHGRTVIEKFEETAQKIDIAFALLTPDDVAYGMHTPDDIKRRARQNVIFELGYFYAKLQRIGGRVVVLHKGPLELPSDLNGIVYMDISNGIEAIDEQLRTELGEWL